MTGATTNLGEELLFKQVDYRLNNLLSYIDLGDIGLPDIQRPFVWSGAQVRDLFDSMFRGFPVGYLLFWANSEVTGARSIGTGTKEHDVPRLLVIDGQQRLTSLYTVLRGKTVLDKDYRERRLEIAFRPRDGKFDVADAAIKRDPEYIPDISELWSGGKSSRRLVNDFIAQLQSRHALSDEEEEAISHNLDRLIDLQRYPFTALEIASSVDEEQVADIFVRINSQGVQLKQTDFILTLMSVHADAGRVALEEFCRQARATPGRTSGASPANPFSEPDPGQLVRVAVALGFYRGTLRRVYQLLRGKDMETGQYSIERRDEQFRILGVAQAEVLNLTHWHQFFDALMGVGYRGGEWVSSETGLWYCYAMYLLGRTVCQVPSAALDRVIGRWFLFSQLTHRYTGSSESMAEEDLNRLRGLTKPEAFVQALEDVMMSVCTRDFWSTTLPNEMETSNMRSAELFAFFAAQVRLGAPVLFSHKRIADVLDPSRKRRKAAVDRHHLFPKAYLVRTGFTERRVTSQIANFALVEWPANIEIDDQSPEDYLPQARAGISGDAWVGMARLHALPEGWQSMPYEAFLAERRILMACIIREGFESLALPS